MMKVLAYSLLLSIGAYESAAREREERNELFGNLFRSAPLGGRCGRFRECQNDMDCVGGLNKCLPVDCIADAITTVEPALNAISTDKTLRDISAQAFNASGVDTKLSAQVMNIMTNIESEFSRCPALVDTMQVAGTLPFVGGAFEIQVGAQAQVLVAVSPNGLLQGRCRGRGLGIEVAATAIFGAFFTEDVSGTWNMIEIADIIPTVVEIPYFFVREDDSAIGIAFGVGTALGFDTFSQSTCKFTLTGA